MAPKCYQCNEEADADTMVAFGDDLVCTQCKSSYVQRLKEGLPSNHRLTTCSRFGCPQCGRKFKWIEKMRSWQHYYLLPKVIKCPSCGAHVIWEKRSAKVMVGGSLCLTVLGLILIAALVIWRGRLPLGLQFSITVPMFLVSIVTAVAACRIRFQLVETANKTTDQQADH